MPRKQSIRLFLGLAVVAAAVAIADQVTKALIVRFFAERSSLSVELLGEWLRFSYTTNTGAAFGLLPDQTWLFVVAGVIVMPIIVYLYKTLAGEPWPVRMSLGLLLGGTIGNFVDRVRTGYVVDFIDMGIGTLRWPSYNVADSAFVVGTIILAAYVLLSPHEQAREQQAGDSAPRG